MPSAYLAPHGMVYTGHVRAPNKDHLQALSHRRHQWMLQGMLAVPPPASWDSRTLNWINPVKNQRSCGSCWLFSGYGLGDIAYTKAGIFPLDGSMSLSEQYFLSCGRSGGCNGDDNTTALAALKATGAPLESEYGPYDAREERCNFQQSQTLYKIDDWGFANSSGDTGQTVTPVLDIKAAIMKYAAVGCAIAADNAFSNATPGQIFNRTTSHGIDHDVELVGWEDTASKVTALTGAASAGLPASVTASDGYWWLKNSWSESWCEKGYVRIGWGVNLVGTEAVYAYINASAPPIDWVP